MKFPFPRIEENVPEVEFLETCVIIRMHKNSPKTVRENILWGVMSEFSLYDRESFFVLPCKTISSSRIGNTSVEGLFDEILKRLQYEYGDIKVVEKVC